MSPAEFGSARPDTWSREGLRGLVVGDLTEDLAQAVAKAPMPVVAIGSSQTSLNARRQDVVHVHNDDEDIGRLGAETLLSLGNLSGLGFVAADSTAHWSRLRERGFRAVATRRGVRVASYRTPFPAGSHDDLARLRRWLKALPRPAAVMAAYDRRAVQVLECCRAARLDVPGGVAVLGVDNDSLLCDFAEPSLSSIAPDHVQEGRLAAQALEGALKRPAQRSRTVLCADKTVVVRESTSSVVPAAALIQRALDFIATHATSPIDVSDVVAHLGVSRALADLRFRTFRGQSIAATIREVRLAEVCRRLRTSATGVHAIAVACGWPNPNHLANVFKRAFGMSMRAYRQAQGVVRREANCPIDRAQRLCYNTR